MLVPCKALNGTHRRTEYCTRGADQKRRRLAAEQERQVITRAFRAYEFPLEMMTSSKYLGWEILATENDWSEVLRNLAQAKTVWSRMPRILSREVATPRVSGLFFKAVIQAVLLFRAET